MPRHEVIATRPKVVDDPSAERVEGPVSHGDVLGLRSYTVGPLTLKSPELARLMSTGAASGSGVRVDESSALTSSPVWSAVALISDDIGSLPLHLYKRLFKADGSDNGKERFTGHPLYRLLHDSPNPEMDSMVWRRTMQAHALLWGNAYAEIERNGAGQPLAIWPLCPERVTPFRRGGLMYRVTNPSGGDVEIPAANMIHLVGPSHDGTVGANLVQKARESFGLALAAEKFGASFFGNGSTFGGTLSFPGPKPPEMSDKGYRDSLDARHQGVERAYKLLALYNGATFTQTGVNPNEGQFTETRVFQIREVARWFKMPPHKLGDLADATYSNVEQMDAAYLSSCLRPWLILWEQQLTSKLIARLERSIQFIEHDTHGFLSVDATARAELYTSEFRIGGVKPNEMRGYENRNPVEGGDEAFVSLDVMPLRLVGKYWELQLAERAAKIEKLKEPTPAPVAPPQDDRTVGLIQEWRTEHEAIRAEADAAKHAAGVAEQRAADLSEALAQETAAKDAALADLVHVRELLDGAETALATDREDHARAVLGITETRDKALGIALKAEEERDALRTQLDGETAARTAAEDRIVALEATVRDRVTQSEAVAAERDALAAQLADAVTARDAAVTERGLAVAQAVDAESRTAAADQRAEAAERDRGIAEHAQQAANETIAGLQAELQRTKDTYAERVAGVLVAHRGLVVDVMRRMVEREIDRAKRHQTTPQKFRAWLDTFYQTHTEAVAEALLPAVRAHLSVLSSKSDPHEMARQLAEDHVAASEKQLRDLLHVEDFAPMLERTLAQWETSRPEMVADRLLTKGLADVR